MILLYTHWSQISLHFKNSQILSQSVLRTHFIFLSTTSNLCCSPSVGALKLVVLQPASIRSYTTDTPHQVLQDHCYLDLLLFIHGALLTDRPADSHPSGCSFRLDVRCCTSPCWHGGVGPVLAGHVRYSEVCKAWAVSFHAISDQSPLPHSLPTRTTRHSAHTLCAARTFHFLFSMCPLLTTLLYTHYPLHCSTLTAQSFNCIEAPNCSLPTSLVYDHCLQHLFYVPCPQHCSTSPAQSSALCPLPTALLYAHSPLHCLMPTTLFYAQSDHSNIADF